MLLALSFALPAQADVAFKARTLRLPGVTLHQVEATATAAPPRAAAGDEGAAQAVDEREDARGIAVHLQAAHVDVPAMGWRKLGLKLDGTLTRDIRQRWMFDGQLQLRGAPGGALGHAQLSVQVDEASNNLSVQLTQSSASANVYVPLDQITHAKIDLKNLPARWLQGLLSTVWSGKPTGGTLSAELALDQRDDGIQASGEFTLARVDFDTPTGTLASKDLGAIGRMSIDSTRSPTRMSLDSSLHGGQLLLGPIFANLPAHAVALSLEAEASGGVFSLNHLHVGDPGALQLDGALAFDKKGDLRSLDIQHMKADFPGAYDRYGKSWLASLGLSNLDVAGELSAQLDLRADGPHAFSFDTSGLSLSGNGPLAVQHLRGGLDWSARGSQKPTRLSWGRLSLYRLVFGPASASWQSRNGTLALQHPLTASLFGGTLHVPELEWQPAAAKGERLSTSMAVAGVDMGSLSKALGWPAFPGSLGGAISGLRWVGDRVELQGGLSMNVFGGFVDMTALSLEHPLGDAPVLTTDVSMRQLDLAAITSVFDFGNITGPLAGSIDGLRLVDWTPVAFDAQLLAGQGGKISQQAVNNLTSVGGGGVAAGLQGAVMRLFKTFGYNRIGLNCKLQGTVCRMSGLEPESDGGYTIVEGSGLPHLTVIGHQSRVDWPVLVGRLKAATEGAGPVVR